MFPDWLNSYTSQKNERSRVIREIHKQLQACQQKLDLEVKFEISKWKAPRVLSFSLKSKVLNESIDFDVLPAFNVLGKTPEALASGGGRQIREWWWEGGRGSQVT